jgi:hypothetical protein
VHGASIGPNRLPARLFFDWRREIVLRLRVPRSDACSHTSPSHQAAGSLPPWRPVYHLRVISIMLRALGWLRFPYILRYRDAES